jgi:hypothetical protein
MKKEYDFSKGTQSKFYNKNAQLNVPIYLDDDDNKEYIDRIVKKKKSNTNTVVNEILRSDKELAKNLL